MDTQKQITRPRSIGELNWRVALCKQFIHILETECSHDERYEDARDHYEAQLLKLQNELDDAKFTAMLYVKPAPVIIGLKSAQLTPRSAR